MAVTFLTNEDKIIIDSSIDTKIANMVDSAPETLNTLNELAAALGDDPNFATTITNQISEKVPQTRKVNGKALSTNITLTAADVNAVPDTRTVNRKALSSNITLSAADVGATTESYVNNNFMSKVNPVGSGSFSMNRNVNTTIGQYSHAEGNNTEASGDHSHAEGRDTIASGTDTHAEGGFTIASGNRSHAEGSNTVASGTYSHAEGSGTITSGMTSHAEGQCGIANGMMSHVEGFGESYRILLTGSASSTIYSFAFSSDSTSIRVGMAIKYNDIIAKIIEKTDTTITLSETISDIDIFEAPCTLYNHIVWASGAHVEGSSNIANGRYSHAEGKKTITIGESSHAEGYETTASGDYSHAEGWNTIANYLQHVQGKYNIEDTANKYAHIVGNGKINSRSNAHTLDWDGNAWFKGNVYVGGAAQDEGDKLITKTELDAAVANAGSGNGGGTGLPVPEGPNLQLVTDADGNWTQAERLAYSTTGTVEIWPETAPIYDESDGQFFFIDPLPADIVIGNSYTVTCNGTEYACTAVGKSFGTDENGNELIVSVLGNLSLSGGEVDPDTGEPFMLVYLGAKYQPLMGVYAMMVTNDGATEATVSITAEGTTYKKISFDYLPEGVGGVVEGVVLPEVTAEYNEDMGGMQVADPLNMPITVGNEYTVMWNGTEYKCVAQEFSEDGMTASVLGNIGAAMGGAGTGEPFIILDYSVMEMGISLAIMTLDGSTSATLSISGETIKKIDPKYLDLGWTAAMEGVGEVIVAPTIKFQNSYNFTDDEAAYLTEGAAIVVYVNDRRYESKISRLSDAFMVAGNLAMYNENMPDTGEPFIIVISAELKNINFKTEDAVKFAIYKAGSIDQIPSKLPDKFMPEIGAFYVNVTGETADKTSDDIIYALETRRPIFCYLDENPYKFVIPFSWYNGLTKECRFIVMTLNEMPGSTYVIREVSITGSTVKVTKKEFS